MSFYFLFLSFTCVCVCLHVSVHVCMCACWCACICMCVHVCVCVHACTCVYVCECVYMFACVYGHVCMCGSTCLHACVGMHGVQNHPQWLSLFSEPGSLRQSLNSVIRLVSLANMLWASPLGTFGDWHDKRATIPSCILRGGFGGSELQSQAYKAST